MVAPCEFGIESTVVKIDPTSRHILVLRRGAISTRQIEMCLRGEITRSAPSSPFKIGGSRNSFAEDDTPIDEKILKQWTLKIVQDNHYKIEEEEEAEVVEEEEEEEEEEEQPKKKRRKLEVDTTTATATTITTTIDTDPNKVSPVGHVAPGQGVTHYAPDGLVCFVAGERGDKMTLSKKTVVIDFNGSLAKRGFDTNSNPLVVGYKDLSAKGDVKEAAKNLFAYLRWCETVGQGAEVGIVADVGVVADDKDDDAGDAGGVMDRIFRACSGKRVVLV